MNSSLYFLVAVSFVLLDYSQEMSTAASDFPDGLKLSTEHTEDPDVSQDPSRGPDGKVCLEKPAALGLVILLGVLIIFIITLIIITCCCRGHSKQSSSVDSKNLDETSTTDAMTGARQLEADSISNVSGNTPLPDTFEPTPAQQVQIQQLQLHHGNSNHVQHRHGDEELYDDVATAPFQNGEKMNPAYIPDSPTADPPYNPPLPRPKLNLGGLPTAHHEGLPSRSFSADNPPISARSEESSVQPAYTRLASDPPSTLPQHAEDQLPPQQPKTPQWLAVFQELKANLQNLDSQTELSASEYDDLEAIARQSRRPVDSGYAPKLPAIPADRPPLPSRLPRSPEVPPFPPFNQLSTATTDQTDDPALSQSYARSSDYSNTSPGYPGNMPEYTNNSPRYPSNPEYTNTALGNPRNQQEYSNTTPRNHENQPEYTNIDPGSPNNFPDYTNINPDHSRNSGDRFPGYPQYPAYTGLSSDTPGTTPRAVVSPLPNKIPQHDQWSAVHQEFKTKLSITDSPTKGFSNGLKFGEGREVSGLDSPRSSERQMNEYQYI